MGTFLRHLRHAPANRLGAIARVARAIALTLGILARGEPVTGFTVGGLGLILLGISLVHRRRERPGAEGGRGYDAASPEGAGRWTPAQEP